MEVCVAQQLALSSGPVEVKKEWECVVAMSLENDSLGSSGTDMGFTTKQDTCDDFEDSLDHIVLSERRKMLLSRLLVTSSDPEMEVKPAVTSDLSQQEVKQILPSDSRCRDIISGERMKTEELHPENHGCDFFETLNASRSERAGTSTTFTKHPSPASPDRSVGAHIESTVCKEDDIPISLNLPPPPGFSQQISNCNQEALARNDKPSLLKVEVEHLDPDELDNLPLSARLKLSGMTSNSGNHGSQSHLDFKTITSLAPSRASSFEGKSLGNGQKALTSSPRAVLAFPSLSGVKAEPLQDMYLGSDNKSGTEELPSHSTLSIKPKSEPSDEDLEDELDHMPLKDRIKLLCPEKLSTTHVSKFNSHHDPDKPISVEPISFAYPHKRRKTTFESPQKALEEDAPELWKVLVENGISTEEMKLYGEPESDEVIDDALCETSFDELEAVIWKVFAHHPRLLKLGPMGGHSGMLKTSYCVGCLLSLVEQAQFLRSRKWPVEWGWSRDLRAFIFVFQNHNRIVLERPQYGYATYFFEMLDSFSIGWQIKRLVIAMRLTNGGRVTMLENKPLIAGEDISEGEARVLEKYGWVPNTGLGTMLNFSDRVVHDIKNERNGAEWRLKIRNLLIKGFRSGVIVPNFLQVKKEEEVEQDLLEDVQEDDDFIDYTQVKLELM